MRRFLLLCLSLVLCISLHAESLYLGYCEGEITSNTASITASNKTIQCAICLPAATVAGLAGQHITRVNVGVNPDCTKLPSYVIAWVRTSPNGSNLAEKKVAANKGWNDIAFDTPVEIPAESDLWVGFSYPQASTKLKVVAFGGEPVEGCSYWYNNGSMSGWADHSLDAEGALCVEAIVEGDNLPQHDLAILNCDVARNTVKVGTPIVVNGTIRNNALATAEGFEIAYSVNDGQLTGTVPFSPSVAYRSVQPFSFSIPTDGFTDGNATVSLELNWLGGIEDEYVADNQALLSVGLFTQGFARNVLLEEFTTEKCPNCPPAVTRINNALDTYNLRNSVVWVCHHAGYYTDFLTVSASQTYCAFFGTGGGTYAPAIMVDRTYDSYYSDSSMPGGVIGFPDQPAFIAGWLSKNLDEPALVGVDIVSATCIDGEIKIKVRVEKGDAFDAITTAPYINVWIKESEIDAQSQSGWSGSKTGYHENALRQLLTATWGDPFTWDGLFFEAEYTCKAAANWVPENLEAVAFVSRYNTSVRQREVYNSAQSKFSLVEQGITTITNDEAASSAEYSLDGKLAGHNARGIVVRRSVAADGSVRTEKVLK